MRRTGVVALSVEPARTVLEERIRKRRQTFEEFTSYAAVFAREHGESGTLSLRNLQRLAAGEVGSSQPRPATVRLLERIFEEDIEVLLSPGGPTVNDGREIMRHDAGIAPHALRVAVAVVVRNDQVLVVSRRGGVAVTGGGSWQFPAGMVKPGAGSREVAVSETLAETGVHSLYVRALGTRLHPLTSVYCDYHRCEYIAGDATNCDAAENSAVTWVRIDQLLQLIPERMIFAPVLVDLGLG